MMMLTVDDYYDWYLKGKSLPEIMREIEKLRKTMASLKSKMESPEYNKENNCWPNEKMQICATRAYLNRAKEAYAEAGGVYEPTKAEKKAADFAARIPLIDKIILNIDSFNLGLEVRTVRFMGERTYLKINNPFYSYPSGKTCRHQLPISRELFLQSIKGLNIGEWRPKYNVKRFGYTVIDGSDWSLEIYFSDEDKPFKVYGDNNYLYNFADLYELLSFDETGASLPGETRGLYFRVEWLGARS